MPYKVLMLKITSLVCFFQHSKTQKRCFFRPYAPTRLFGLYYFHDSALNYHRFHIRLQLSSYLSCSWSVNNFNIMCYSQDFDIPMDPKHDSGLKSTKHRLFLSHSLSTRPSLLVMCATGHTPSFPLDYQ